MKQNNNNNNKKKKHSKKLEIEKSVKNYKSTEVLSFFFINSNLYFLLSFSCFCFIINLTHLSNYFYNREK